MLFVSRSTSAFAARASSSVSISESRCFSFQVDIPFITIPTRHVSISESRCFSFQGRAQRATLSIQTRRSFNLGIEMLFVSSYHFLAKGIEKSVCFNLGIEMLFVSSAHPVLNKVLFQCFNLGIEMLFVSRKQKKGGCNRPSHCFNLGIEMLFVSSQSSKLHAGFSWHRFNLGIEMLFVSRLCLENPIIFTDFLFQSRNRDAFRFKCKIY